MATRKKKRQENRDKKEGQKIMRVVAVSTGILLLLLFVMYQFS